MKFEVITDLRILNAIGRRYNLQFDKEYKYCIESESERTGEIWLYDIYLNGKCVGDSGDFEFETKEEARADADDYCISELSNEYGVEPRDFEILLYKSQH